MAYGTKYRCEWRSPMREQIAYLIEILEEGYSGSVSPLYPRGDVLTITQGQLDASEFDAIKSSEAVLSLLCKEDGDPYMSLFTTDPMRYKLNVRRIVGAGGYQDYWQGYLVAGTYTQSYSLPPYHVEVRATDGLALLKDMPYLDTNGQRYTGVRSLRDIISAIMPRISDKRVISLYDGDHVVPGQNGSTLTFVGVDSDALYSTLGGAEKIPSCYDVLSAVLESMQYQLYQSYGQWYLRPVSSLLTTVSPSHTVSHINNNGKELLLYSDNNDGVGMSTSATLSLLPAYKKIIVDRPSTVEKDNALPSLVDSKRWTPIWNTSLASIKQMSKDAMRMVVSNSASSIEAYGLAYVFDGVLDKSDVVSLSVTLDAYNLGITKKTFRAGLLLVAEGADPIASWNGDNLGLLDDVNNVAVWSGGRWTALSKLTEYKDGGHVTRATVVSAMPEVTIEASKRYVLFDIPVAVSSLTMTTIDTSAETVSSDIAKRYKLVFVLAARSGLPEMELRNPTFTIERSVSVELSVRFDESDINTFGIGDITFKQTFADAWMLPVDGQMFEAPLINMTNGAVLRGLVSTSQRQQVADVARSTITQLRSSITRQLEGDVYIPTCVDMGAIWKDRQGRRYYTNYVRRLLRRGVYNVQLREIRSALSAQVAATFANDITNVVGMDTSAMWLSLNGRNLYRYDAQRDSVELVMSSPSGTYPLTLNAGQCCACVISYDGTWYTLTAYNTHGEVISQLNKAQNYVQVFDTSLKDVVMRAARFDANINTWSLIGGDGTVTYTQIVSGEGYNVSSDSTTNVSFLNAYAQTLLPNGYAFSAKANATAALYSTYWHSFAHHPASTFEKLGDYKRIVACNEIYLLIENSRAGNYELYYRTDTALGYDTTPLLTASVSKSSFVDMNNALVVFRNPSGYGAFVYDGRTGNTVTLSAPFALADTVLWLSSDTVYGAWTKSGGGYGISRYIINNGAGTAAATIEEENI